MKKVMIFLAVIFGIIGLSNAQSKSSYSVFSVDNKKMISSDNVNYEVDIYLPQIKHKLS